MIVHVNRDGICMGDDTFDHIRKITIDDHATSMDLLNMLLEMQYLPDLTDSVWYMTNWDIPCIIAFATKEKKVIAEVKENALAHISDKRQSYQFYHCNLPREWNYIFKKINETDGIWYDKDFFEQYHA